MFNVNALAPSVPGGADGIAAPLTALNDIHAEIKEAAAASAESMASLIARELPRLRRLAWTLVRDNDHANDLVQDTMVRVLTYAHNWQPGTNFGAWVGTIMRNQFYTQWGGQVRELMMLVRDEGHDAPVAPAQDNHIACTELAEAIDRLPKAQRQAITLAAFEGLNSEEIAARMNITPNAARCHLMRARKQLRATGGSKPPRIDPNFAVE